MTVFCLSFLAFLEAALVAACASSAKSSAAALAAEASVDLTPCMHR